MTNLTRVEAGARSALIDVTGYRVELDLAQGPTTFESSSTVSFTCAEPGASTFLDVKPQRLHRVTLNGVDLDLTGFDGDRVALNALAGYSAHGCRWAGWVWPGVAQQVGQRRRGESSASSNACRDRAWSSVTSWWSRRALSNQSW